MTDINWVGKVTNIETKNGQASNGNSYTYTNFKFQIIRKGKEGAKVSTFFLRTFDDIGLKGEGYYMVGLNVMNRKKGDSYALELVPSYATKLDITISDNGNRSNYTNGNSSSRETQGGFDDIPF